LSEVRDAVAVAREIFGRVGPNAIEVVRFRVEALREADDRVQARFWSRVERALRLLSRTAALAGHDVTAPLAERALPLLDQHYREVFNAAPHAYLLFDTNLRIVGANHRFLRITSTTRDQIIGRELADAFGGGGAEGTLRTASWMATLTEVLDSGDHSGCRERYDLPDGDGRIRERWWEAIASPVFDRGRLNLIIQHVTESQALP
jgi:PAS domain S-box-containing protein